jgi:multidrug efflux pump subunit AcrA (membrane-fusion protein)
MNPRSALFAACLALIPFAASGAGRGANLVILDEAAVANLKLKTAEAEETDFEETVFVLGRIRVAPGRRAVVSSRVPGRALSVSAHLDTRIEKGAEAVVLESRQAGDPPPTIKLPAPISGFVSAVNVSPGQPVSADDSLVEIVDLDEVHAVAAVPEHLLGRIQLGQKAHVRAPGYPDRDFEAKVDHIGIEADSAAGTVEVAFHVSNPGVLLRPKMRVEFAIITGKKEGVISVPREALQGDGAQKFVYVADYELKNAFVKTPVVTGASNDRAVEIIGGILPGDEVVVRGGYALVFAGKGNTSLKEAMDAAHGHAHAEDGSELTDEQKKAGGGHAHENEHGHGHGHEHEHGHAASLLDSPKAGRFFAATTAFLFLLLAGLGFASRNKSHV